MRRFQPPQLLSIREQTYQALAGNLSSLAPRLRRPALRFVEMAKEVDGYRLCLGNRRKTSSGRCTTRSP